MSDIAKPIRRHHQEVVCVESSWPTGTTYEDPALRVWMLYATLAGRGRIEAGNGSDFTVETGDLILIQPGRRKRVSAVSDEDWRLFACHFPGWPRWKQWLQWPRSEPGVMHLHLDDSPLREQVWRCLGHAARALQMADELALPFAANHLERALLCCQRALPADANGRVLDPRVRRALFFISEHLTDRLANADIARAAGSSPQHLCALFRDQVGKTPLQYQEELRLVQAMRLLRSTLLSIQQVATQVGFADPFYFSNRFRRRAGCSPREYRRQHDG